MRLRTGLLLLGEHPPGRLVDFAVQAEALGFAGLWYADERFYREVYTGLALCAQKTTRLSLGPCVTDPYSRHPALTAMAIATLDEVSGGRAVLGIGAGVSGFRELGIARERPAVAIREAIHVIRGLLRGETVTYRGQLVRVEGARLNFTPLRPDVPIYLASNAPRGLQTAGRLADGAIMQGCVSAAALDYFRGHVARGAKAAGRDPAAVALTARVNVCIHDDQALARNLMRRSIAVSLIAQQPDFPGFVAAGLHVPQHLREAVRGLAYGYVSDAAAQVAPLVPDAFVDALTLAGPVEVVATGLARMVRRGITQFVLYPTAPDGRIDTVIERFATEVLPRALQGAGAPGGPTG
jgi:5,10-methylenetetrahydromethanopterin reductase